MDIETVHEIAPQARLVYYNARRTPGVTNNSDVRCNHRHCDRRDPPPVPWRDHQRSLGICELSQNSSDMQADKQRSCGS